MYSDNTQQIDLKQGSLFRSFRSRTYPHFRLGSKGRYGWCVGGR